MKARLAFLRFGYFASDKRLGSEEDEAAIRRAVRNTPETKNFRPDKIRWASSTKAFCTAHARDASCLCLLEKQADGWKMVAYFTTFIVCG